MLTSKKVLRIERGPGGACPDCQRRHIHMDNCPKVAARDARVDLDLDPAANIMPPMQMAGGDK